MMRSQRRWDEQLATVQKKIKSKNAEKHRIIANYERNKTKSKRRKQAEQGYIDSKTQVKNLMKSEKERLKSSKKSE